MTIPIYEEELKKIEYLRNTSDFADLNEREAFLEGLKSVNPTIYEKLDEDITKYNKLSTEEIKFEVKELWHSEYTGYYWAIIGKKDPLPIIIYFFSIEGEVLHNGELEDYCIENYRIISKKLLPPENNG